MLIIIIAILAMFLAIVLTTQKGMRKEGVLASIALTNHSGLEVPNAIYKINAYEDRFEFVHNKRKTVLKYNKVEDVAMTTEVERLTKNKGIIGRSVVGGAIAGTTGAIVGGMTGQNKTKNQLWPYIVITYQDNSGETSNIIFKGSRTSSMENPIIIGFYNKVKKIVPDKKTTTIL